MNNIAELVKENRNEAVEILKKHGGRIEFVTYTDEEEIWDNINEAQPPHVIVSLGLCGELADVAVLSVSVDERGRVWLMVYDINEVYNVGYGKVSVNDCVSYSDNEVYTYIIENYL